MRKRFIYPSDGSEPFEVTEDYRAPLPANVAHNIIPDFAPFRDTTGVVIKGRAHWREHVKQLGGHEVGAKDLMTAKPKTELKKDRNIREHVQRSINHLEFYNAFNRPRAEREGIIKAIGGKK